MSVYALVVLSVIAAGLIVCGIALIVADLLQRRSRQYPPAPKVVAVFHWANGMVAAFDERGQQVPEYQGRYEEVRERLAAVFPEERWNRGVWRSDQGWLETGP